MANTLFWTGGAPAVAQVQSWLFAGTWLVGEQITLSLGSKSYTYTLASGTIATFLASLTSAYNALSAKLYPEYVSSQSGATASNDATHFILTANAAGVPFASWYAANPITLTTNSAAGTIDGGASSGGTPKTFNDGPNDWTTALNWTGGKTGAITGATNATPISVTSATHGLATGDQITIYGVLGNLATNGKWFITKVDNNTFTLNSSVGSGTYTANTGNWIAGPTNGDTVNIQNNADDIEYGLGNSSITLAALNIYASFTGTLGLPKENALGTAYPEYRYDYLMMGTTVCNVGQLSGQGSGRIKLDSRAVTCTWTIYAAARPLENNIQSILLKGTSASNVLTAISGSIGVAYFVGETANLSGGLTIGVGAGVVLGNVTLATVTNNGGQVVFNSAIGTMLTQLGGVSVINGTGACGQLNLYGGTCVWNSTGSLNGTTIISNGAILDFDQNPATKTVTNQLQCFTFPGFRDNNKVVSSLVVDYKNLSVSGFGTSIRLTRGAPA